ncbi:MAG: hypothetical protein JNM56_31175 [Planctomycetia bacterium]|nr:hypothetical protein [Planctomycetia bacterium]
MAVVVALPLFGSPDREIEATARISGEQLRQLGASLQERLQKAATLLDQLRAAGWTAQVGAYDLLLAHPEVQTQESATQRLHKLGIDPNELMIFEEVEDEEA